MLDKESYYNLLKEIADTGGPSDAMMELLQKLRDDFDEREGMLRRYGETSDSESPATPEAEERIREESEQDNEEDGGLRRDPIQAAEPEMVPKTEYDELRRKYIERFFMPPAAVPQDEHAVQDEGDGVKTFDELFK